MWRRLEGEATSISFWDTERVSQSVVSLLGGEDSSLYSLGTSSIATVYRVAGGIKQNVPSCSNFRQPPVRSQGHGAAESHFGSKQAAFEPLSQIPSARPIYGSPEAAEDHSQPEDEAPRFPCSHLAWFILLRTGTIHAKAGEQGLGLLVTCSEGLNTLGWSLGVSSPGKRDSESPSNPNVNALEESNPSRGLGAGQERQFDRVSTCKHYKKGWCWRGQACKFHHGDLSDSLRVSTAVGQGDKEVGSKICPHFLKGNCRRGVNCGDIHSLEAASSTSADLDKKVEQKAQAAQVRCPHFDKGYCRRGDTCRFAHVNGNPEPGIRPHGSGPGSRLKHQPLAEDKKQKLRGADLLNVCFRWAQGGCDNKACRFSHRHLGPWELRMFKELLDSNEASPTALPAGGQAPLNTGPAGSSKGKPHEDAVGEGRQWDTTVHRGQA